MLLLEQMIDVEQFVPQSSEVIQKIYAINVSLRPKKITRRHNDRDREYWNIQLPNELLKDGRETEAFCGKILYLDLINWIKQMLDFTKRLKTLLECNSQKNIYRSFPR